MELLSQLMGCGEPEVKQWGHRISLALLTCPTPHFQASDLCSLMKFFPFQLLEAKDTPFQQGCLMNSILVSVTLIVRPILLFSFYEVEK